MRVFRLVLLCVCMCVELGCDGSGGGPADGGAARSRADGAVTQSGGDGGPGGLSGSEQLDPALIPRSFAAYQKSECGELGESCSFLGGSSCAGSICDLGLELCVPNVGGQGAVLACVAGSCPKGQPYCLGGRCMSFEQASCICGAAGGSALSTCAAPAISALGARKDGEGNVCLPRDVRCGSAYSCCSGLTCAKGDDGVSVCQAPCVQNGQACENNPCCGGDASRCLKVSDTPDFLCYQKCSEHAQCPSGCCSNKTDPEGGFCVEAARCSAGGDGGMSGMCEMDGAGCGPGMPCCTGLTCVLRNGAQTGTCHASCTTPGECASGCCTLFTSSPGGFCDQALNCTCIPQDQGCGTDGRACCSGSRCARYGDEPSTCVKTCESAADCGGNCCQELSGGPSVCADAPC